MNLNFKDIEKVHTDAALTGTCRDWFRCFKDGDFDVDDRLREERPKTFEEADVICYELLKPNETITGERYRTQFMRFSRALREKRPQYEQRQEKMILQHNNARPHVAKYVETYLETLKWQVLPHPPYSLDIAPSDYYLFRSMAHALADQQFRSYEDIEKWLDSWIASKDEHFYSNGFYNSNRIKLSIMSDIVQIIELTKVFKNIYHQEGMQSYQILK